MAFRSDVVTRHSHKLAAKILAFIALLSLVDKAVFLYLSAKTFWAVHQFFLGSRPYNYALPKFPHPSLTSGALPWKEETKKMSRFNLLLMIAIVSLLIACQNEANKKDPVTSVLFTLVPNEQTKISFKNVVRETAEFNVLNYYYSYNGAGVAIGDVNNDGLQDVFLTSNQQSNKLYLNKGNFEFEDITAKAGVGDPTGWTTGVNMIDINNDGWLDIYVCKSASLQTPDLRKNILFINQKNGTFSNEAAKWGLDDDGFSIQSYFFDYDKDGDLDMYLINHRVDFLNSVNLDFIISDKEFFPETSDHLYRNDGNSFSDVTIEAGLKNKEFSLSASIGDYNNDGWWDIYVANDFITPDRLYVNNQDGTFSNEINSRLLHTSYSSMGSDYADINNDLYPDLMVLDMSAEDHARGKQNMPSMNTSGFWYIVDVGYHYTYMSNILNINNGNGTFTDIAQLAGVSKTDWSWAPLIADFDNDGFKDVFVTNGIRREIANQDFGSFLDNEEDSLMQMTIDEILNVMPSEKLQNYVFRNEGNLAFSKVQNEWGLDQKINSNGAAYADLDNDGDLDLVLNNLDDEAVVYRNNATNNFISVSLIGSSKNRDAIGAKVRLSTASSEQYQELFLARGYQSSVSPVLNFGVGQEEKIERIEVIWGDGKISVKDDIRANRMVTFRHDDANTGSVSSKDNQHFFASVDPNELGLRYRHVENEFDDFSLQVLLPQKQSCQGPVLESADVNNDGLMDLFLGGALQQVAELYLQNTEGRFEKVSQSTFVEDKEYEDNGAHFFDADGDGDLDLYVTSGGYELKEESPLLQDRLYINDGNGVYYRSETLPQMLSNTKAVTSLDFDGDGDQDLVVAGRTIPGKYPLPAKSFLLENRGGQFIDVTESVAPDLGLIGLVNDMIASDYDGDGDEDLILAGEWMPITVFRCESGLLQKVSLPSLAGTNGWWNTIAAIDFDNDGDEDYFVGNLGGNNKFHPSAEKPLHIYGNDFDEDGRYDMILSKLYHGNLVPVRGKECSSSQNSFISEKITTYMEFANSTLSDIYGEDELENSYHREVYELESVYLKNEGNGAFQVAHLPNQAQLGPTMSFVFVDVNEDGHQDVLGVGGIHEAEVETVRYDGNVGYVLLGDSLGGMNPYSDFSFYNKLNAKRMALVDVSGRPYIVIANNNDQPTVFRLR